MQRQVLSIQFLRFVAATLVVFNHAIAPLQKLFPNLETNDIKYLCDFGASGVHIFFVISGFVMVYTSFPSLRADFSSSIFVTRRFTRIYPIYWLCALLYISFRHISGAESVVDFVGAFFLIPGYSSLIIGPAWTLAYEVYFYLCFAIFMTMGLARGLTAMAAFFVCSIALGSLLNTQWLNGIHPAFFVLTNTLLLEFMFGALIAYGLLLGFKPSRSICVLLLVTAIAAFAAGLVVGYHRGPTVLMWGVPSALLIGSLAFLEQHETGFLVKKFAFLGDSSYSLYLLHVLIVDLSIAILVHYYSVLGSSLELIALLVLIVYIAVGLSYLFHESVEKTLLRFVRNAVRRLPQRRPTM
jgi:exopolysaccharide production protein ExoZ